jgi:4-alpha-glucanotransferase
MAPDTPLARLAAAHGVATRYEGSDRVQVEVDEVIVRAVLAELGVDPDADPPVATDTLPGTIAHLQGATRELPDAGVLHLEEGGERSVGRVLPADLPLGHHRLVVDGRESVLVVAPARLPEVPRTWGWMLQLYSLHSQRSWGMGDHADLAAFARDAADQGAGVLLVNPVQAFVPSHPLQRSPYSPSSRRFASPLYLSIPALRAFAAADETTRAEVLALAPPPVDPTSLVDHDAAWAAKLAALEVLWHGGGTDLHPWEDQVDPERLAFATYSALAERHGADWRTWPDDLRDPDGPAVARAREELADRVAFHAWLQSLCDEQLAAARAAGDAMAVGLVHDLPVGVDPGGADAWAQQDVFASAVRVGCPADAFNPLGQDWGLPPWRPDRLDATGYAPFRDVVRSVLRHGDGIRIDHVAGLWRLWWIPPGEPAHRGTYVHYDADVMLAILTLEAVRAGAIVVGEDLGTVEDVVTETMHERGMLSSAVLWFERDWDAPGQPHVPPRQWEPETMASISTHDLPTVAGWLVDERVEVQTRLGMLDDRDAELARAAEDRQALLDLLRTEGIDTEDLLVALHAVIAPAASRLVLSSPADAVGQLQQPNLPGTIDEYPNWRVRLPVDLDAFFAHDRVRAAVGPLRAARPATP